MKNKIIIGTTELITTKTGKRYLQVTDYNEIKYSCWEEILWPVLEGSQGKELQVEILDSGKYKNIVGAGDTMMPAEPYFNAPNKRGGAIAKAQERKAEFIEKAQGSKELGIKVSSTMRDAVLIVTTFYKDKPMTDIAIKNEITKWRDWLWANWEKEA